METSSSAASLAFSSYDDGVNDLGSSSDDDLIQSTVVHMLQRWLQTDFGGHNSYSGNYGGDDSTTNTPIRNSHDTRADQDTYEFIAFVLWYLFLVMCCVIPTCCAYRRRRLVEARLAQQQSRLAQQQFDMQQQNGTRPNFLLFDQLNQAGRRSSERVQSLRTEKLGEELQETTMTLSQGDIVEAPTQPAPAGRIAPPSDTTAAAAASPAASPTAPSANQDDDLFYGEDAGAVVNLPANGVNGNRAVPCICAICLCTYEDGERVSWSPESNCQHAFHTDCIIPWLAKKEEQKCPVCRQDYCQEVNVNDELMQEEHARAGELFLDSFALALSYARAQSVRNWEEMSGQPPVRTTITTTNIAGTTTSTTTTGSAMAPVQETADDNNNDSSGDADNQADVEMGGGGAEGGVEMVTTTTTTSTLSVANNTPVADMQMDVDDEPQEAEQVSATEDEIVVAAAVTTDAANSTATENNVDVEEVISSPSNIQQQ